MFHSIRWHWLLTHSLEINMVLFVKIVRSTCCYLECFEPISTCEIFNRNSLSMMRTKKFDINFECHWISSEDIWSNRLRNNMKRIQLLIIYEMKFVIQNQHELILCVNENSVGMPSWICKCKWNGRKCVVVNSKQKRAAWAEMILRNSSKKSLYAILILCNWIGWRKSTPRLKGKPAATAAPEVDGENVTTYFNWLVLNNHE